mgnify:CR=1 FL=1
MKAKEFEFDRNFLKHTNYKNGCHVYTGMETVLDKSGGRTARKRDKAALQNLCRNSRKTGRNG